MKYTVGPMCWYFVCKVYETELSLPFSALLNYKPPQCCV